MGKIREFSCVQASLEVKCGMRRRHSNIEVKSLLHASNNIEITQNKPWNRRHNIFDVSALLPQRFPFIVIVGSIHEREKEILVKRGAENMEVH